MVWITEVAYVDEYKIKIMFNDNTNGIIDFAPIIEQDHRLIIKELKQPDIFQNFSVKLDTLVWPNGADFSPEYLYENIKKSESAA